MDPNDNQYGALTPLPEKEVIVNVAPTPTEYIVPLLPTPTEAEPIETDEGWFL